jgi:hypothetical protein
LCGPSIIIAGSLFYFIIPNEVTIGLSLGYIKAGFTFYATDETEKYVCHCC